MIRAKESFAGIPLRSVTQHPKGHRKLRILLFINISFGGLESKNVKFFIAKFFDFLKISLNLLLLLLTFIHFYFFLTFPRNSDGSSWNFATKNLSCFCYEGLICSLGQFFILNFWLLLDLGHYFVAHAIVIIIMNRKFNEHWHIYWFKWTKNERTNEWIIYWFSMADC